MVLPKSSFIYIQILSCKQRLSTKPVTLRTDCGLLNKHIYLTRKRFLQERRITSQPCRRRNRLTGLRLGMPWISCSAGRCLSQYTFETNSSTSSPAPNLQTRYAPVYAFPVLPLILSLLQNPVGANHRFDAQPLLKGKPGIRFFTRIIRRRNIERFFTQGF
jgi:hypothetical protein